MDLIDLFIPEVNRDRIRLPMQVHAITRDAILFDEVSSFVFGARNGYFVGDLKIEPIANTTQVRSEALIRASYRLLIDLSPWFKDGADARLAEFCLTPDIVTRNTHTAAGVANLAADKVFEFFHTDGANMLGDMNNEFFRRNYSDSTGYVPVNRVDQVNDLDRWQPLIEYRFNKYSATGEEKIQKHSGNHFGDMRMFSGLKPQDLPCNDVSVKYSDNAGLFRRKVINVLKEFNQTIHNETRMMEVELWENKLFGPSRLTRHMLALKGFNSFQDPIEWGYVQAVVHAAMQDSAIYSWYWKRHFDRVRPVTAVRELFTNRRIPAYVPGVGVRDVKGSEWRSYIGTDAHSEHPSFTACLCYSVTGAFEKYLGTKSIDFTVTFPKGSSYVDPGRLPSSDITVNYKDLEDLADRCAIGRVWNGVHFPESTSFIKNQCTHIGYAAHDFVKSYR
jgi:hypothetical protein